MLVLLSAALTLCAPVGTGVNYTLYGLRPYSLRGLDDHDSADALGDTFFLFGDRIAQRERCASDPTGFFCSCEVTCVDNVYTQYTVTIYGGIDYPYGACNPTTTNISNPQYVCRGDDGLHAGSAVVNTRYATLGDGCIPPQTTGPYPDSCGWKYYSSKHVGGMWFSTPAKGNCDTQPASADCTWRIAETRKIVNESCLNDQVISVVEQRDPSCFTTCPQPTNTSSHCYLNCFFANALQVPAATLQQTWENAFASSDPKKGGCPGRVI